MKQFVLILGLAFLLACSSNSEKTLNTGSGSGDSTNTNLNTLVTNTIFDSIPMEKLPYTDSIAVSDSKPLRQIKINPTQLAFLQFRNIRDFSSYYWPQPDSAFTIVCRLPLSENFYSIIFNYEGQNESMNYLIHYDSQFRVIDYIEVAYDEWVESALRTTAVIDAGRMTIVTNNYMDELESKSTYQYAISTDGFFREIPAEVVANAK